ncbi:hypothetical protein D3C81_1562760 [compost metagenome]
MQVPRGFAQQLLGSLVAGVHALVERRVADDGGQITRRRVDTVAGDYFSLKPVGGEGQAAAFDGEGVHVEQGQSAGRIAALERGADHPGAAAEVQYVAAWQVVELFEEQGAATVEAAVAEHAGQADDLQRAVAQRQFVALRQGMQVRRGGRLADAGVPELAVAGAVEFAGTAECGQLLAGAFDTGAFFANQIEFAVRHAAGEGGEQVVGEFAGFR